jgi:hypothetical protein
MIWLNLAVIPHFSWPNAPITLPFEGKTIVLSPPTEGLACRLALFESTGTDFDVGGTILSRFLSRLAWAMNSGVCEIFFSGSNNPAAPGRLGAGAYGQSIYATTDPPHCIYIPTAGSQEADLALALFREAMSVNSEPFAFLSYYKVLNIRYATGHAQERWINDNLRQLWYQPAVDRLNALQLQHPDIGHYMYVQGRCAIAHANGSPLVNPDVYVDKRRMRDDMPLMKELAALFIEQELGVLSEDSFHKQFTTAPSTELLLKGPIVDGRVTYAP